MDHSDNLFEILRVKILEKSKDKEAIVRMQACMALCRLQDEEDQEIVERLAEMMQFDPSA